MAKTIPFAPMPMGALKAMSAPFIRYGAALAKQFPGLELSLRQAEIDATDREYASITVFLSVFYFLFFTLLLTLIFFKIKPDSFLPMGIGLGAMLGILVLIQLMMYPTMLARKKERSIEKNLVFSLRAILVQLKSGVSLFDALNTIASGEYGAVSTEFKKAVDQINTGRAAEEVLEKMAENNPSPFFRKAMWQIVTGMQAGAEISAVLSETVASMLREQRIAIIQYGSALKFLSLMYMMVGIIMPALGVTLLIILLTFPMVGEAISKNEQLIEVSTMVQNVMPGETYGEGSYIYQIKGKQDYSGQMLKLKVMEIKNKAATFQLFTDTEEEEKVGEQVSIYMAGENIRDYFEAANGVSLFNESFKIKSIGPNLFGQEQIEVTRLEPTHLLFWGMLGMLVVMQFMYVGIIKSRRPNIIG